jgi:predicted MFS family arabinose efflux permease
VWVDGLPKRALMRWATVGRVAGVGFFNNVYLAVSLVFFVRTSGLSAATIGILLAVGGVGGALGGVASRFVGGVRVIWVSMLVTQPAWVVIPLVGSGWAVAVVLFVTSFGTVVYNVAQVSLRQSLCPSVLLGRMNASVRFLAWGAMPLGALLGGFLAGSFGVSATLWVAAVGMFLSVSWLLLSPLRTTTSVAHHG